MKMAINMLPLHETRGAYHLQRKTGNSGWKIKWYVPFRSERSGKSGRSFEPIHFSRSFRFSRLVCEPFQFPALFKSFHARQNKMAENEGNEGEFENCQINNILEVYITENYFDSPLIKVSVRIEVYPFR